MEQKKLSHRDGTWPRQEIHQVDHGLVAQYTEVDSGHCAERKQDVLDNKMLT